MEPKEYNLKLDGFTIRCFNWEEVERFATSAASHRAHGTNNLRFGEEYDKIMAQVLTENDDTFNIEERR